MAVAEAAAVRRAAEQLIEAGRVLEVRVLQSGAVMTGIVAAEDSAVATPQISNARTFRVYIRRAKGASPADLAAMQGECSCGQGGRCAHVAAVLLAAQKTNTTSAAERTPLRQTPSAANSQQQQLRYVIATVAGNPRVTGAQRRESREAPVARRGATLQVSIQVSGQRFTLRPLNGTNEYPRYVDERDKRILGVLGRSGGAIDGPWIVEQAGGTPLLWDLLGTGRAFWETPDGLPLRHGAARSVGIDWQFLPDGAQQLAVATETSLLVFPELDPPVYVDVATGACGELNLSYPAAWLRQSWAQPAVAPEQIDAQNELITAEPANAQAPRLRGVSIQRDALHSLTGRLVLSGEGETRLSFLYNGLEVDSDRLTSNAAATVRQMSGGVLYEIERDPAAEQALRARLTQCLPDRADGRGNWLAFMLNELPALQAQGWDVITRPDFAYRIVLPENWYGDLQGDRLPGREAGWFNLRLGVVVEGKPVNLLPALTHYLQASLEREDTTSLGDLAADASGCQVGDRWLVRLEDGRYVPIALERIQRIAQTLVELFDRDALNSQQALSLPRSQTARLALLAAEISGPIHSDDASVRALMEELRRFSGIQPLGAPEGFRATLREYQQEGLGWLQFLRRYGFGGLLADDMGLGKTVQTLAHLTLEKLAGRLRKPALIVAPVSAIGNWQQEIHRFTPELELLVLHGNRRREQFARIRSADIVLTAYPLLHLDAQILLAHEFYMVILDEAQTIKNPRAKVSQSARALRSEHRLCLSGTPLENHLGELWSLFDFLQPGLLGDERSFQRHYRTPIERNGESARGQALAARIAPFLLRRTKDAVARELPPKTEIVESIVLEDRQRDLYDAIRLSMHQRVRDVIREQGLARSQITILDALLKLRQVCCDPRLLDVDEAREEVPSAKLDWLTTVLPELVAEGRRILLFSQFTSMLRLVETAVRELGIPYCLLTGETTDRTAVVQRFQSGTVPLFLISLKAGGTALNLTAADTVIHYDPWWNPAAEAQATDRAHRIGQDKPVFVYKLIAHATVEERILQLQADKHALASRLYGEKNASPGALSAADLEFLFSS